LNSLYKPQDSLHKKHNSKPLATQAKQQGDPSPCTLKLGGGLIKSAGAYAHQHLKR
jgi:hypothetical protein